MASSFRVLDAGRAVVDEVNALLGDPRLALIYRSQLRDSAQSISANIREGLGRDPGADRNRSYRVARGSAEESDEHLRANFADGRIPRATYLRLHSRLVVIVKMLNAAMR